MSSPFRAFVEASLEPAWVADERGRAIEANAAADALFGFPVQGRFVLGLIPTMAEAYARVNAGTQTTPWSAKLVRTSGCKELSGWLAPWLEAGERKGSLCVAREVTRQLQLEAEARTTRSLLETLVNEIPDPIALRDERGEFLLANRACAQFLGRTPAEMVGKSDHEFGMPVELADRIHARRMAVMKSGVTEVGFEDRYDATTGQTRHLRVVQRPFKNEEGLDRLLIVAQDVTEMAASQRKVAESEQRLQEVLDVSHEGMWDWHLPTGRVLHNPHWYALSGVTPGPEHDTLEAFDRLLHPEDRPLVHARLQKLLSGEVEHYRSEHRLVTPRGELWVMDRGRIVERDAAGNVVRVAGACSDVTAERRATQELVAARRAAEASSVSKTRFLATMSHELRTPLNGILGMAQMIIASNRDEEAVDAAGTILSSGRMLLAVLNDILDLSKVEAGRLKLEVEPLEPALLIDEVQKLFSESALRAGVGLSARVELEPHATYLGDPTRLRQMLCNLVSNALKFTTVGRVELGLRADGAVLEFSVTDTGAGIAPERQAALFQPFSQVHDGAHLGGTGLGLSIVRRLAEMMGGSAGLESVVGQGSRVWFRVPLTPAVRASSPSLIAAPGALPTGLRVMAAEDNATNRKVISALLAKLGVTVETVDNGLMAVARLAGEPDERPHLVLMDCQMPELDGLEATARVRAWEAQRGLARLPIVALTASAYEEDRQKALAAGMDDFLAKPVNLEALREVVARWARRA